MFDRSHRVVYPAICLAMGMLAAVFSAAYGQYPGHIDTQKKASQTPRAIAVLEWTGEPGKPSASRMIPISVFDGESYQPGGLYLARPEPLAVESGTEYILQDAGIPKGLFDVNAAQDMQGYWFGYGTWKQLAPPPRPHKLERSKIMPHVVTDADDSRPHFKNRNSSTQTGSSGTSQGGTQTAPGSSSTTQSDTSSSQIPDSDPDRPTLRRRPASSTASNSGNGAASSGPETVIGGADPDRPHLTHGSAHPVDPEFESAKLSGTPVDLQQMIAVSDATDREPHPFAYSWPNPGDAAKMQAQMETLAKNALAPPAAPAKPAAKPRAAARTAHPVRKKTHPAPPSPALAQERFHVYELTYGGGATLVFSAQSTDSAGKVKYVTVIGQPDFYGTAHTIFQSVTDDAHLDETPRMRLVDAVDPRANNRGDLVFELRGRHDRQFAIYQIAGGQVEQVFTTGSLPLSGAPAS